MKTPEEYELIIRNLILHNKTSVPCYSGESSTDSFRYYRDAIYFPPYHTYIYDRKEGESLDHSIDYLFNKIMNT
jgi:hypothetical protein